MEYRFLGKTGLKVSELCLGTMTFGCETPEDVSLRMMGTALSRQAAISSTPPTSTRVAFPKRSWGVG